MIYYSIPYNVDKNLGKYYNDFMEILPNDDDYACFVDGDTIFTTSDYGSIIHNIVLENPEVGCFTSFTNRVNSIWQIAPGVDIESNDMKYHRDFGRCMQDIYGTKCIDVTDKPNTELLSGLLIMLNKKTWKEIGKFAERKMLGIDNDIHLKLKQHNKKLYLMVGIYLYHWYRWPNKKDIRHLV